MTPEELVDEAIAQAKEIENGQAILAELKKKLIELGPGKHLGSDGKRSATVVQETPKIQPTPDFLKEQKTKLGAGLFGKLFTKSEGFAIAEGGIDFAKEKLKPTIFSKIFQRVVRHAPVKGFREVAKALLGERTAERLISQCEVAANPYVKLSA